MPFAKGHPKPPNSGKRKGSVNKGTERARRLIAEGGRRRRASDQAFGGRA
jgi:hypothetical protein